MEKQLVTNFSEEWFGEGFMHEPETETKTIEEKPLVVGSKMIAGYCRRVDQPIRLEGPANRSFKGLFL